MFDGDLTSLPTPELLESAAEHRAEENRRAARLIEHAQIFADRHHPDVCAQRPGRRSSDGRERAVVLGGEGCPEIAEFAPAEFGVMIGVSAGAAAHYIGQALALRHRLPFTWARVQAGEATPWKARKIATACLDLSEEAARAVDRRVAKIVDSLTPDRLEKIVEAAKKHADPEGARKNAEEKAQERGVYVSRSDEHGTKKIFIRTSSGNALLFNAKIGRIAAALKDIGDTRNLQHRRSEAVGIITDSHYTEELLRQARNQRLTNPTNSDHPVPEPSNPTNQTGAPTSTTRKPAAPTSHQASTPPAPRTAHADSGPHPAGKSTAARSAGEDAGVTSNPAATPTEVPGPHTDAASTSHHDVATSRAGRPSEARGAGEDAGSVSDHDVPTSRAGRPSEARGAGEDAGSVSDHDVPTSRAGRPSEARGAGEDAGSVSDHDVPTSRAGRPSEARGAGEDAGSVSDQASALTAARGARKDAGPTAGPTSDQASTPVSDLAAGLEYGADEVGRAGRAAGCGGDSVDQGLLDDWGSDWGEPGVNDEADRDAPHPSVSDLPDPLDAPFTELFEPFDPGLQLDSEECEPLDAAAQRALDARLAQIKHDAHTNPSGSWQRPGQTEIYVHLTDHTLATGTGVLRVEGLGPLLAAQLTELVGHGPYTVKPVIDLNKAVAVDAYEIPDRIRERVKLMYPFEVFPYGVRETHAAMDLDHIEPYDPLGPSKQTSTSNLAPLRRFSHRVKTHGRWKVRRLDAKTLEWITPNGFTFHVDPTGTHRVRLPRRAPDSS